MRSMVSIHWVARFFACHLGHHHCDAIYGYGGDSLRSAGGLQERIISGSNPTSARRRRSSPRRRRSSPAPTPACTAEGQDPFGSGAEVACCSGLNEVVKNWDGDDHWYYKCVSSATSRRRRSSPAPSPACTAEGQDPFSSGAEVPCCAGLNGVVKNWDGGDNWYYKCVAGLAGEVVV